MSEDSKDIEEEIEKIKRDIPLTEEDESEEVSHKLEQKEIPDTPEQEVTDKIENIPLVAEVETDQIYVSQETEEAKDFYAKPSEDYMPEVEEIKVEEIEPQNLMTSDEIALEGDPEDEKNKFYQKYIAKNSKLVRPFDEDK